MFWHASFLIRINERWFSIFYSIDLCACIDIYPENSCELIYSRIEWARFSLAFLHAFSQKTPVHFFSFTVYIWVLNSGDHIRAPKWTKYPKVHLSAACPHKTNFRFILYVLGRRAREEIAGMIDRIISATREYCHDKKYGNAFFHIRIYYRLLINLASKIFNYAESAKFCRARISLMSFCIPSQI